MIAPGATIGILGGGQLGRMLSVAAAALGYRCHVYAPDDDAPAAHVAALHTRAAYDDIAALDRFAATIAVATFEFENVPVAAVERLAERVPVRPGARALAVAQDRVAEKRFAEAAGGRAAPWAIVDSAVGLAAALTAIGTPAILKTRRMGYDGKGQVRIAHADEAAAAWAALGGVPAILEGVVAFDAEFSILAARGVDGAAALWDAPVNEHRGGILYRSSVPAGAAVTPHVAAAAALTRRIADALGYVGVLGIEYFATIDGPVFNEMAPRVHNSGHWTIEGARTSQFENHIRAVVGLPLGPTGLRGACVMQNLLGDEIEGWARLAADPELALHLYGKRETSPGRKMGHFTRF